MEPRLDGSTIRLRQRYFRWQNGTEHTTETDGGIEQVLADNVVVMMADYGVNTFDGNPDAQVLGSNPVVVFTGGTARSGSWLRFAGTDPFGLSTRWKLSIRSASTPVAYLGGDPTQPAREPQLDRVTP